MPALGADMEAGTLVEWLIKPGDRVKRGDVVAVVETQKGAIEVEMLRGGDRLRVGRAGRHQGPSRRRAGADRRERRSAAPVARHCPAVAKAGRRSSSSAARAARRRARQSGDKGHARRSPARRRTRHRPGLAHRHWRRRRGQPRRCRNRRVVATGLPGAGKAAPHGLRLGRDAQGDCCRDGTLKARDPALLPRATRSISAPRSLGSKGSTPGSRCRSACCRRRCC